MVLVELDHGELLLERASALLLHGDAVLQVLVVSALVLGRSFDHLAVVRTVFLRVSLMAGRRVSQRHGPMLAIDVAAINVAVAVTIHDLVPIDKDQVCSMRLLNAL